MAYCTPADVRAILNPTGDATDTGTAAGMNDAALNIAIGEAQAEIDGRLAVRYQLPFTPVPALIFRICRDKAAWLAMLTQRGGDPVPQGDPVTARQVAAEALLVQIVSGQIQLEDDASGEQVFTPEVVNAYTGDLFSPRDVGMRPGGNGQWRPASDWPFAGQPYGAPPGPYGW